jgi:hypothetical protein
MEGVPRLDTFGEIFQQFMIEVVATNGFRPRPALLLWDGRMARVGPSVSLQADSGARFEARTYEPPPIDPTVLRALRMPACATDYESTRKLFDEICALIKEFTGLTEKRVRLAAHSVFASWFPDATGNPIYLSIVGPRLGPGAQLFRLLSCLYRRPLVLGDCSLAEFYSIPTELCPSVFIEQHPFSSRAEKLLSAVGAPGAYVPRKGKLMKSRCSRVTYGEEFPRVCENRIDLVTAPTHEKPPSLDWSIQEQVAGEFQPKLLMYRLRNYGGVTVSQFDAPDLLPSVREAARSLGACVPDTPDLQKEIAALLSEQNEGAQADLSTDLNSTVIEALLSLSSQEKRGKVHVGEIATAVNAILEQHGEPLHLTPRMMSNRLKSLGLLSKRLDAAGRGLLLHNGLRQRIYQLALDYGLVRGHEQPSFVSSRWIETAADRAMVEKFKKEVEL